MVRLVADWHDVRRIAGELPGAEPRDGETQQWRVGGKLFCWERPLRRSDIAALTAAGQKPPDGPILGVRVADLDVKDAVIAADPGICFTTPHYNGYPAVLVELAPAPVDLVTELITEAWLVRAPAKLRRDWPAAREVKPS